MPSGFAHPVLKFIRTITASGDAGDTPDSQLLDRFIAQRDEAAFAVLVRRHGPMVLGVCARVLGDTPDAEDAFQATFLVLLRRARSVGRPELLGNWLHGVAYRTALKAKVQAARRRRHESRVVGRSTADAGEEGLWRDLGPVLEEELARLPAKYRVPLVLCHLEGQTHEEVARRLGCPRETVTTRLTRARERLRVRMVQRGVTLSGAALGTFLVENAHATVPPALAEGTIKAAAAFAAGQAAAAVVSARVAALAEGVMRAMLLTKLKIAAVLLLAAGLLAWGMGAITRHALAADPVEEAKGEPAKPAAKADANAAVAEEAEPAVSVKSMPPVVVKTVPQAGDSKVEATT